MTELHDSNDSLQITLAEALDLVDFRQDIRGKWYVHRVKGNVDTVEGDVGIVEGYVGIAREVNTVEKNVGFVQGTVCRTINGKEWQYVESQEEKLKRLINETDNKELIETFNQIENNS